MGQEGSVASARATRVDEVTGIREEVGFIGTGPERIFSTVHAPLGQPIGAVLLCSSILAELLAGYQEEIWLSRSLARRGFVVRRFHYRGTGHSDGDADDVTYEQVVEDARTVATHMREETGIDRLGFIGTRVGALIAATVAAGSPGAPLALIQPILKGDALFKEVSRSRIIWLTREEGREPGEPPPEDVLAILARDRWVDVLGYRLTERLYESVRSHVLADELGSQPRPVQLVQVAKRKGVSPDYQRFLDELTARGFETEAQLVNDEIAWWFHDTRRHLLPEIGDAIVPWLSERIEREGAR
ncbi:MAG: alpha/beta hydrolase [Actinomycetota bacterium]